MPEAKRLPLVVQPMNRDETTDRDAKLVNGYVEHQPDKSVEVYKRPGFASYSTVAASQVGYGVFNWGGDVYAIFGGVLYKNGTSVGTGLDTSNGVYTFTSCLGATPALIMQNGTAAYSYDATNGLVQIQITDGTTYNGTTYSGSAVITNITPNTSSITVGQTITGNNIPSGATVTVINSSSEITISATATASGSTTLTFGTAFTGTTTSGSAVVTGISPSTSGLFVGMNVYGSNIPSLTHIASIDSSSQITMDTSATASGSTSLTFDSAFPSNQVKGVTYLDGYINVMTQTAQIYSSDPNLPHQWGDGNYLSAQIDSDPGVFLTKQLVYIVAMKAHSIEMFYDAGNASGSPLGPFQGGKLTIGCRSAGSVAQMEGTIFWISQAQDGGVGVYLMDGTKPMQISTPPIERLLQQADYTTVYSWCARVAGHRYYCVTLVNSNLSLVFDLTSRQWYQWTDTNGNYLPYICASYDSNGQAIFQHATNGNLYHLEITNAVDDNGVIPFDLYTPNFDGGVRQRKYLKTLDIIGDQNAGSTLQVRSSDDDYQSWTNFREIDLSKKRPCLMDCGTFRRRAYHFHHACNTPLRIVAAEMYLDTGTL